MLFCYFERLRFEWRRHGTIPAGEKTRHRDGCDNFDDLLLAPMPAQLGEDLFGYAVRQRTCRDRERQRRFFRRSELRAGVEIGQRGELLARNAEMESPARG